MDAAKQSEMVLSPGLTLQQVHGALLGAAVGDALGWPQEQNAKRVGPSVTSENQLNFRAWRRNAGGRFQPHEEEIAAGDYSDDTQLLLATVRSLLHGEHWRQYLAQQELPLWLLYERGGGGATKRAVHSWQNGSRPWRASSAKERIGYFHAGGNGVAMRVLPHVLVPGQTVDQLGRDVMRNGTITHGHPRALLGAILYARAAWWIAHTSRPLPFGGVIQALMESHSEWERLPDDHEHRTSHWLEVANGCFPEGYQQVWQQTVEEILEGLRHCQEALADGALVDDHAVLKSIGCFDRRQNGSGVVAALCSVYLFAAHAANPLIGLRTIAYAKSADTDTIASMLGGLYGLCHGLEWLPTSLHQVQDYNYFASLANELIQHRYNHGNTMIKSNWTKEDEQRVIKLLHDESVTQVNLGVFYEASVISHQTLKSHSKSQTVVSWKIRTSFGQTLYIKHISKREESSKIPETDTDSTISHSPADPLLSTKALDAIIDNFANNIPETLSARNALYLLATVVMEPHLQLNELSKIVSGYETNLSREENENLSQLLHTLSHRLHEAESTNDYKQ